MLSSGLNTMDAAPLFFHLAAQDAADVLLLPPRHLLDTDAVDDREERAPVTILERIAIGRGDEHLREPDLALVRGRVADGAVL